MANVECETKSCLPGHYESTCRIGRSGLGLKTCVEIVGARSLYKLLQILPSDEDNVVIGERLLEFGARDRVVIPLAPRRSIVRMIDGDGQQFGVVVREVNNDLGDAGS